MIDIQHNNKTPYDVGVKKRIIKTSQMPKIVN